MRIIIIHNYIIIIFLFKTIIDVRYSLDTFELFQSYVTFPQ